MMTNKNSISIFCFLLLVLHGLSAFAINVGEVAVDLGGSIKSELAFIEQKKYFDRIGTDIVNGYVNPNKTPFYKLHNEAIGNFAHAFIRVTDKIQDGPIYGFQIALDTTASDNIKPIGKGDRSLFFVEHSKGRVEIGNGPSAFDVMKIDASSIAAATGGIGGDWYKYANINTGSTYSLEDYHRTNFFLIFPGSILSLDNSRRKEEAKKITFFSRPNGNFDYGYSFIFDAASFGDLDYINATANDCCQSRRKTVRGRKDDSLFKSLAFSLRYSNDLASIYPYEVVFSWNIGKAEQTTYNRYRNLKEFGLAGKIAISNLTLAASVVDANQSFKDRTATSIDRSVYHYTFGARYDYKDFAASYGYMRSHATVSVFDLHSFGADYKIFPGAVLFFELTKFNFNPNIFFFTEDARPGNNQGFVAIFGQELLF